MVVNTVLPDGNVGLPISPQHQGWPSTMGFLKALFDGDEVKGKVLPPQHAVAVTDTALVMLAALLHPGVKGERLFAYAEPKNNNDTLAIFRKMLPERRFLGDAVGEGRDLSVVVGKERAEALLRWIGGEGWRGYRECVGECVEYFVAAEQAGGE